MTRFLPSTLASVIFIIVFACYLSTAHGIFTNYDTPWHLAAGDWIREHESIPFSDPWSFAGGSPQWLNTSWLWDIAISYIFQHAGVRGLYVFTCVFGALNMAALASCLKNRNQISDTYILLIAVIASFSQYLVLFPQPQLATYLLIIIFHHLLHRSAGKRCLLFVLPLLMALWVNLHSGFIAGFTVIAAYAIEAYIRRDHAALHVIIKTGLLCALACVFNPYTFHIGEAELRTLHSVILPYLADWRPVSFGNVVIAVILYFFMLVSNMREPEIRLADKILTFTWLLAGLLTVRNFNLFVLVGAPYFAYCLQEFAHSAQGTRFRAANTIPGTVRSQYGALALAGVCMIVLCMNPAQKFWAKDEKMDTDPNHLRPFIGMIMEQHPDILFLNDYNLGGDLIYLSSGRWRPFVDGRAGTAYSEAVLKDSIDFANADAEMAGKIVDKYQAKGIVLLKSDSRAHALPAGQWHSVYANDKVIAYIKD